MNNILHGKAHYVALLVALGLTSGCNDNSEENESTDEQTSLVIEDQTTIYTTTYLDSLTIEDDGTLSAEEGYDLTLTVDGVETEIVPGSYSGDVVITVTEEIPIVYSDTITNYFRAAVYIEDGAYIAEKSVAAAVSSGEVSDELASGVTITSEGPEFNGILVTSSEDSSESYSYAINYPVINFSGNGGNDFSGFGAAIMSSGYANVELNDAAITTNGAIRTGVFVGGNSIMTVNNSSIETYNGTLPEDYEFNVGLGKMMEAPWVLGITGNVRATNLVGNGTAYYVNSRITSQAWGALSTDDTINTSLYCTNSEVTTLESGYGAYSNGDNLDHFSGCTINAIDYGVIMTSQGDATFTDASLVNSGRIGVMLHSGTGTLNIENGSIFNVAESVIQAKSSFPEVIVDNAELNSDIGVILQMMENDDPYTAYAQSQGTDGDQPEDGGTPPELPEGEEPPELPEGEEPPEGMEAPEGDEAQDGNGSTQSNSLALTVRNSELSGDFVNGNTANGELVMALEQSTVTGAITTATSTPAYLGVYEDAVAFFEAVTNTEGYVNYQLIGQVSNQYEATENDYGVELTIDSDSTWIVNQTSYLTALTLEQGDSISAPDGYTVTMTVDGVETEIEAGSYSGEIVLTVTD
jgi:hypothetical protein